MMLKFVLIFSQYQKNDIEGLKIDLKNNISFELFLEEIEIQLKWQKFIFKNFLIKFR